MKESAGHFVRVDKRGVTGWPVAASQSRAVPSTLAVKTSVESGAERHRPDRGLMRENGAADAAGAGVIQRGVTVSPTGDDHAAIGAKRQAPVRGAEGQRSGSRRRKWPSRKVQPVGPCG